MLCNSTVFLDRFYGLKRIVTQYNWLHLSGVMLVLPPGTSHIYCWALSWNTSFQDIKPGKHAPCYSWLVLDQVL